MILAAGPIALSCTVLLLAAPAASAQAPPDVEAQRAAQMLMTAYPQARWLPDGRLTYREGAGDDAVHRAVDPRTGEVQPAPAPPAPSERRVVRPGLFAHLPPIREVASPDGRRLLGSREGDLWVRDAQSGDAMRLTRDGSPEHAYDVEGARWSPDGSRVAVRRMDHSGVPSIPIVRWSEPGAPVRHQPYSRAGEPIPRAELFVVDAGGGGVVPIDLGAGGEPYVHPAGWNEDGTELYALRMSRLMDRLDLLGIDPATGRARTILSETSSTFIGGLHFLHGYADALEASNHVHLLGGGAGFLWTSERDGWRRLYHYDLAGRLLRPLTPEGSEVVRLEAVDPAHGWVYYTARMDPRRPYDEALLRVRLADGKPERLADGPLFEEVSLAPDGEHLWILRSGRAQPPVGELRRASGELVRVAWSAAPGLVERARLPRPEEFVARAADGRTELHGLLFTPRDLDPARRYPVVEDIYAGPHTIHVPRTMRDRQFWFAQLLADQGFVVVMVDGRGTPGRGKAFQDVVHGSFSQHEIADHAAVLRQLAAERPFMDLERVGVIGHSWGGYFAIRALLLEPELYRVGIALAPAADLEHFRVAIEPYMGCLPADCPEAYRRGSNTSLADRLRGRLLLMHGTADDDVPFGETIRMISALTAARRPYDLVVFPEAHHVPQMEHGPYWMMSVLRYLRTHLQGGG